MLGLPRSSSPAPIPESGRRVWGSVSRSRSDATARSDLDAPTASGTLVHRGRRYPAAADRPGELGQYEDSYRLCYVRDPEGIIFALAEQLS
jgi:hypothetical protein